MPEDIREFLKQIVDFYLQEQRDPGFTDWVAVSAAEILYRHNLLNR
jgi:hypothetical protein